MIVPANAAVRQSEAGVDIIGGRKYVDITGDRTHELPPLLVRTSSEVRRLDEVVGMAEDIIASEHVLEDLAAEDLIAGHGEHERRRMDLAINLVEQYMGLIAHWRWGDSILEWIRQCEFTFGTRPELRGLLRPDVWPHAGRSSFVQLIEDKAITHKGVDVERAVGFRLTFRQPPPIACFSNQFLFYLQRSVAETAFHKWAAMSPEPIASLPPERFRFEVVDLER